MKEENLTSVTNITYLDDSSTTHGETATLMIYDEVGKFPTAQTLHLTPQYFYGTDGTSGGISNLMCPSHTGSMGEMFLDMNSIRWVMSHNGWVRVFNDTHYIELPEEVKGTKRKLKCF